LGRLQFKASLGKKFIKPHLNQWLGTIAHTVIPATQGSMNRKITVKADWCIKEDPI
jgi:hypothetical protein